MTGKAGPSAGDRLSAWTATGALLLVLGIVALIAVVPHTSQTCGGPALTHDCPHPSGNAQLAVAAAIVVLLGALALVVPLSAYGARLAGLDSEEKAIRAAKAADQKPV